MRPPQSDVFDQLDDLPSPSATQDNDGNYTPETGDERDKKVERVGFDLPTPGVFLPTAELVSALKQNQDPYERIPLGKKEDKYFAISNESNFSRRKSNKKSRFWDDCGAWVSGPTNKILLVEDTENNLTQIQQKKDVYVKRERTTENGKRIEVFTPIDPQPHKENVLVVHRAYSTHTLSADYKRRISWIAHPERFSNIAIAEYTGSYPGLAPHGNSKKNSDYIRLPPETMDKIKQKVKSQTTNATYQEEILGNENIFDAPRSRKQVENAKYRDKKGEKKGDSANFADHMTSVENMVQTHPFVQLVSHSKGKVPCVILYTEDQIKDLGRFCCSHPNSKTTVLGFDKTFNLGEVHVTLCTFQHLAVTSNLTDEHPLFVGPIFLHGNSDFSTFFIYFSHLAGVLHKNVSSPVLGSDDELAMRKAVRMAFPKSSLLSCTCHMKQNANIKLKDKIGSCTKDRKKVLDSIFGTEGITNATDDISFNQKCEEARKTIEETVPSFQEYFSERIQPRIFDNLAAEEDTGLQNLAGWTNNNCESINAVLKRQVDWRPQKSVNLILSLFQLVQAQYKELERSLFGHGEYVPTEQFQKFQMDPSVWCSLSKEGKIAHFQKFMRQRCENQKDQVTSTDGTRTILKPKNGGKKPGQFKRRKVKK